MMTKEEAIKGLTSLLEVRRKYGDMQTMSDEIEIMDMAIQELKKGSQVVATITFDRDEMQRSVDKAKEEIKAGIIAEFIDDLNEIYQKLWDVKISAPNIIEHGEHYKQIQDITADVEEKLKKYQEAGREET